MKMNETPKKDKHVHSNKIVMSGNYILAKKTNHILLDGCGGSASRQTLTLFCPPHQAHPLDGLGRSSSAGLSGLC